MFLLVTENSLNMIPKHEATFRLILFIFSCFLSWWYPVNIWLFRYSHNVLSCMYLALQGPLLLKIGHCYLSLNGKAKAIPFFEKGIKFPVTSDSIHFWFSVAAVNWDVDVRWCWCRVSIKYLVLLFLYQVCPLLKLMFYKVLATMWSDAEDGGYHNVLSFMSCLSGWFLYHSFMSGFMLINSLIFFLVKTLMYWLLPKFV